MERTPEFKVAFVLPEKLCTGHELILNMFTLDDRDYLCVVDYYWNYFDVNKLQSKTATGIAKKLRQQFSVHGIPNQLISDNMPFNFHEFKEFAASYEFEGLFAG